MKIDKRAFVKAIGVYLAGNAVLIVGHYLAVIREKWLGIPGWKPPPPESFLYVVQIFFLAIAFVFYRGWVKRN